MTQTANKPVTTEELGWIEREVLPEGSPERSEEFWRSMVASLVHTLRTRGSEAVSDEKAAEIKHDLALLAHAIEYIENQGDDDAWQEFLEEKAAEAAEEAP